MDLIHKENYLIRDYDVDGFGTLLPSRVLFFAQDCAGRHCDLLALDHDTLSARNLFWAVIRHRVQITRMPRRGETITVETWPMPTTRVAYPRSTAAYDAHGQELFRVISIGVLMDTVSRAMILPGKSGVEVPGILRGNELSAPGSLVPKPLGNCATRQVRFTDLDRNDHMNNCRYLDWICDLFPSQFHREHPIKELTLCYLSEAREGQQLDLHWDFLEDGALRVDAFRRGETKDERVLSAKLLFE